MTFDEAKIAIKENQVKAPYLSNWLHIKTGNHYIVKHHVILESNLEPHVVYYRRYDDPIVTWCCPAKEFFDGRFQYIETK